MNDFVAAVGVFFIFVIVLEVIIGTILKVVFKVNMKSEYYSVIGGAIVFIYGIVGAILLLLGYIKL